MVAIRIYLAAAALVAAVEVAPAQSLDDMKDGTSLMVGSGAICSDYLQKPEVLAQMRERGLAGLIGAGMSESEANALMDEAVKEARSEPSNETQMQVACEMVGIKALPVE